MTLKFSCQQWASVLITQLCLQKRVFKKNQGGKKNNPAGLKTLECFGNRQTDGEEKKWVQQTVRSRSSLCTGTTKQQQIKNWFLSLMFHSVSHFVTFSFSLSVNLSVSFFLFIKNKKYSVCGEKMSTYQDMTKAFLMNKWSWKSPFLSSSSSLLIIQRSYETIPSEV